MALIESGASGPVPIGDPELKALLRLQNFPRRNGHPHAFVDATEEDGAVVLLDRHGLAASEVVVCPDGSVLHDPDESAIARSEQQIPRRARDDTGWSSTTRISTPC